MKRCKQCVFSVIVDINNSSKKVIRCMLSPADGRLPPNMANNLDIYMNEKFAEQCDLFEPKLLTFRSSSK